MTDEGPSRREIERVREALERHDEQLAEERRPSAAEEEGAGGDEDEDEDEVAD